MACTEHSTKRHTVTQTETNRDREEKIQVEVENKVDERQVRMDRKIQTREKTAGQDYGWGGGGGDGGGGRGGCVENAGEVQGICTLVRYVNNTWTRCGPHYLL
jgi:hypothetical protein